MSFLSFFEESSENRISDQSEEAETSIVSNISVAVDNNVVNDINKVVCDNEVPTLRRKKKNNHTTRQGPRVTRNLSEEQILSELHDSCSTASPWEFYEKVRA